MAKIVLVGEARGAKEAMFEHGFVGASGVELARMLGETGLAPMPVNFPSELDMMIYWKKAKEDLGIEIANVFEIHPPDNKIETCFTNAKDGVSSLPPLKPGKYVRPDLLFHVENLWKKLTDAQPNLIVAMGNTACWAVLGQAKISALRGTVLTSPRLGFKVLPTYHPAAVLHQWNLRTIVLTDLEKAKREAEFNTIKRIERWLLIEPCLAEIEAWLDHDADYYAVDIETSIADQPLRQIAMIGFARSPSQGMVVPFADERKPGWSYWPTVDLEMSAWRLVDRALKKPVPKVFQNGIFDLSYILRAGLRPTMCQHDTMLLHHALYPEMLKSLGFLGSIYSAEIAWKTMRTRGNNLKRDE
jgi:uracil-DNA glycosylase